MMGTARESFELGPIRPPSEAFSLLIRVTRNCPWNRCKFCPIYKGEKFQLRSVDEVKQDIDTAKAIQDKINEIAKKNGENPRETAAAVYNSPPNDSYRNVALWMYSGSRHAFLQDANTLIMKAADLVEIIGYLKKTFPEIDRVTSYARSHTVARKSVEELKDLYKAGLSRIHIGMESGYDPVLEFLDKGITAADHITAGKNVVASGISLCEYVMLGAGGKTWWREHALATAEALNQISPDYIRFRTLTIQPRMLLYNDVDSGEFVRASDDEIVTEEKLLIGNLDCPAQIVSDHMINLLPEVEGKLPEDKDKMLAVIERFLSLSPEERDIYKLGRRIGLFNRLDDLTDVNLRGQVEGVSARLGEDGVSDDLLFGLMERYI
jgi:histone acetyltransferase (RNA polymerase elongator complex component)